MRLVPIAVTSACALVLSIEGSTCDRHPSAPVEKAAVPTAAKIAAPLWTGPAFSGSWYTSTRSGEGFALQVLENGSALVVWFTYPPAGSSAQQAWILGLDGKLDGDRIRFEGAFTTRGPRFGAGFDPSKVQVIPWGTIEFRFTSCNDGELTYSGPAGWGSGTRPLVRLSSVSELECTEKKKLQGSGARSMAGLRSRSGSWFDPTHNGEGWQVEELADGRAQVYWFTYDDQGEQAWTIGTAPASGERIEVAQNLRPVGTRFGADFNTAAVQIVPWGRLTLQFDSCDAGQASYQSDLSAFGSGTLRPARLSRLAGAACLDSTPVAPTSGAWSAGTTMPAPQSEGVAAIVGAKACAIGGFGDGRAFKCYDVATGAWSRRADLPVARDHPEAVVLANGDILYTGGYRTDALGPQETNGWRYSLAEDRWGAVPELPDTVASGAALLGGFAYFSSIGGALYQVNPRTLAVRALPRDTRAFRDHSQLVAFQGELWLIGGRDTAGLATGRVSIFDPASETWRAGPNMIETRSGFAAAATDTMIIVAGGERLAPPARAIGDVEAIAAGETQWARLPALPNFVHGVPGVIQGNAFITLGGSSAAGVVDNRGFVQIYRW